MLVTILLLSTFLKTLLQSAWVGIIFVNISSGATTKSESKGCFSSDTKDKKDPSTQSSNAECDSNPNLLGKLNSRLEVRRKSIDEFGYDPLQKEVFNQTLIYAAKETLTKIHSEDHGNCIEEEPEEIEEINTRRPSNGARQRSYEIQKETRRLSNENGRLSNGVSEKQKTKSLDKEENVSATSNNRRRSSVQNVSQYNRMTERKRGIKRKESISLVPVKEVKGLTTEQIEEIKRSFNELDINKDGRLSKRELIMGAYRLGMNPTDEEVDDMIREADANNDGFIDFNEFMNMMKKNYVTIDIERERMKAAFSLIDKDGNGLLSKEELMSALVTKTSGITPEDVEEILKDADIDGNEEIDFNEFVDSTICAKLF